jgi:hypothetical protein
MDDGHCGLPTNELVPLAEKLLEIPQDLSARRSISNWLRVRSLPTKSVRLTAFSLPVCIAPNGRLPNGC